MSQYLLGVPQPPRLSALQSRAWAWKRSYCSIPTLSTPPEAVIVLNICQNCQLPETLTCTPRLVNSVCLGPLLGGEPDRHSTAWMGCFQNGGAAREMAPGGEFWPVVIPRLRQATVWERGRRHCPKMYTACPCQGRCNDVGSHISVPRNALQHFVYQLNLAEPCPAAHTQAVPPSHKRGRDAQRPVGPPMQQHQGFGAAGWVRQAEAPTSPHSHCREQNWQGKHLNRHCSHERENPSRPMGRMYAETGGGGAALALCSDRIIPSLSFFLFSHTLRQPHAPLPPPPVAGVQAASLGLLPRAKAQSFM